MITCSCWPKRNPSYNFHFIPHPQWLFGLWCFVESGATTAIASVAIVLARCGEKKKRLYSGRRTILCGSDRRRAVADLHVEFLRRLGLRRLLQHVMLHDHLLVGVDGRVRVIWVVTWLVAARLIRRLRGQWLLALTAQQLAAEEKSEEEKLQTNIKCWNKEQMSSKQCVWQFHWGTK